RDDAVQTIRERLPSFVVVRAAVRFFHYRSGLHETGRTARPAKKIVVALPREFTPRQRVQALEEYIRENLNADGYAATYAIHDDGRGNNPHAHILVANRQIDPATGGWARLKQRMEYVLDERGERVPLIDPETGRQKTDKRGRRQWKRTSVSLNPLDRKAKLKALRESWADTCNARLDETERIDHRSLEDQGSDLEPTIHEGYAARAIERAGGVSERCEANREIRRSNRLLTAIRDELNRIFDRLGELFAARIRRLRPRQTQPGPAEPNWRYFEGDARRQLEADRADHTAALRGKLMDARADVRNREEWWRSHGTEEFEAARQIIDVALKASREARDANIFKRGRLLRNAEQVAGEQSARLRMAVPWLEDTAIPSDWDQASRFRMRTTKAIHDHDMKPRTDLVAELEKQLEQAERAGNERPSPEQVKALALRMAERRTEAEKPKPARTDEEGPSTPQGTPRENPRNPEERRRKTKADLFAAIERKVEEKTGEERQRRQKREQTLDDLWEQGQWNRPGHGFSR
ncbi:MAG: MobA/MobL family protein, partial [Klebsiella aerogenes]|nr:MobA/MobL family protein [Klebsiella aerogenes]